MAKGKASVSSTGASMSDELVRIANALERIADFYEKGLHVDIDHAHIDDIGEIHGDVTTHPKNF